MSKTRTPEGDVAKNNLPRWRLAMAFCLLSLGSTALSGCRADTISTTETPDIPTPIVTAADLTATITPMTPTITPPTPTTTPIPATPTATAKPERNIYAEFRSQMQSTSVELRQKRQKESPLKWARQILPENQNISPTILILGCGYDLTVTEKKARTCSNKLAILEKDRIIFFAVTHDLGMQISPGVLVRTDILWRGKNGGFESLRDGWQSMIRAPIDTIVVFENTVISDVVRDGFGNQLPIDNPMDFTAQPVWINDKLTEKWHFPAGRQNCEADRRNCDGERALQFVTSTPDTTGPYDPRLENHNRLDAFSKSVIAELNRRKNDDPKSLAPLSLGILKVLTENYFLSGKIATDYNLLQFLGSALQVLASDAKTAPSPDLLGESVYLLDPNISPTGQRGIKWGTNGDPFIRRVIQNFSLPFLTGPAFVLPETSFLTLVEQISTLMTRKIITTYQYLTLSPN